MYKRMAKQALEGGQKLNITFWTQAFDACVRTSKRWCEAAVRGLPPARGHEAVAASVLRVAASIKLVAGGAA